MSNPYVGEIRIFAGNFAPAGWALCDGQLLAIAENETLFIVIGTTYGGDGQVTFALPDLRGRVPVHMVSAMCSASRAAPRPSHWPKVRCPTTRTRRQPAQMRRPRTQPGRQRVGCFE